LVDDLYGPSRPDDHKRLDGAKDMNGLRGPDKPDELIGSNDPENSGEPSHSNGPNDQKNSSELDDPNGPVGPMTGTGQASPMTRTGHAGNKI